MNVSKTIWRETALVALGMLVCSALECAVCLLIGRFSVPVLAGTLYGSFFSVLNFFLMCIGIQQAMEREEGQSAYVKRGYALRMLLIVAALAVGYFLPVIDIIAACIPFLALKPVIYLLKSYEVKRSAKENGGETEA